MNLPKVTVFSLGGTISSTDTGDKGVEPTLTGKALIADVPQIADVAEVSAVSFRQASSGELTLGDLVELAKQIEEHVDAGAVGAVITQGTDTIEETSFALDLLVNRDAPVVVTGAMRNPTLPGADGPANLLAAIRVVASGKAKGSGTTVVLNDEIHAARFVRKTHTHNPATFRSPNAGPIGWISEGEVRLALHTSVMRKINVSGDAPGRPVALLTITLGDDGRLLGAIEEMGYEGLVIEAMGGGHVPSVMVEELEELSKKIPVVLASRTGGGAVLRQTYWFPGSEMDLLDRGLIHAGALDGLKTRLLLSLLLRSGASREEIQTNLEKWVFGDNGNS